SLDGEKNAQPLRKVAVSDFYLSETEVTNNQFIAFLNAKKPGLNTLNEWINLNGRFGDEKCRINKLGENYSVEKGYENFPVIYVSWLGAIEYCKWREYRLPSEAEWEYAAGGGSENRTLWSTKNDEGELFNYAVFDNLRLAPVKSKIANKLGLYDMSGNVKEWCADQWHENYYNAPLDSS
ncbi:MAG: SUMF1/EgtB/PvdO family nonheme iron enzyme, partial [Cyclobacteriaceae bacterium]|nr:SUMF1/EgtB/PvdO family nonheme iron enzyme [Cyclobacteriaceae bacterium]